MIDKALWLLGDPQLPKVTDRGLFCLIFDRNYTDFVYQFNNKYLIPTHNLYLDEVDASGSRTVWLCFPVGQDDYDFAKDMPEWVYDDFRQWLFERHNMKPKDFSICQRRPDPGLGIMLPEDFESLNRGELPDGVIRAN